MNTLANAPDPGLTPELPVEPVAVITDIMAAAAPEPHEWSWHRVKDILVMVYAYGLLGFGVFFPLLLAAWSLFNKPAGQ